MLAPRMIYQATILDEMINVLQLLNLGLSEKKDIGFATVQSVLLSVSASLVERQGYHVSYHVIMIRACKYIFPGPIGSRSIELVVIIIKPVQLLYYLDDSI